MCKKINFDVSAHFLPALIMGDRDGLDHTDLVHLDSFIRRECVGRGHWSQPDSFDAGYGKCEITGYKSSLESVTWVMMEKPAPLRVIFRVHEGELIALFPSLIGTNDVNTVTCYARVGQHSSASVDFAGAGRLAIEAEYTSLLAELAQIYAPEYTLVIAKRMTPQDRLARITQSRL